MNDLFPFIVGAVLVFGVGGLIIGAIAEKKRREMLQGVAAARGWSYDRRDDSWTRQFHGTPFGTGHNRQAHNILRGQHDGREFVGFDYVYHTTETSRDSNGNTTSREVDHWFSVVALRTSDAFPTLQVTPENFVGRFIGKLTNRDIELESEDFNRAFTVVSPDRKFAYDILHPRLMEQLLRTPTVGWRIGEGWIRSVESGRHRVEEMDHRLSVIDGVLDVVPDFVREQYGIPPRGHTGDEGAA